MNTGRLEAFSDGVLAIIITIMVLAMTPPKEPTLDSLYPIIPVFVGYLLSFIYVGIYWVNHHHIMHVAQKVDGYGLLANLHLLFWLSLIPFTTGWVGENYLAPIPIAFYGGVLFMSAVAFRILEISLIRCHSSDFLLRTLHRNGLKERLSMFLYFISVPLAFVSVWISIAIFFGVACLWIVPSKKIEQEAEKQH